MKVMKMKRVPIALCAILAVGYASAFVTVSNNAAPAFALTNAEGKKVSLDQFKGKWVVLEWWNNGCPVVQRHYNSGNIPGLQKEMKDKGVVWLSIVSSGHGKQGYVDTTNARSTMDSKKGVPADILLDPTGEVGKLYNAKTTPQMVLISPKQEVMYNGAIDNNSRGNLGDSEVINYLTQAYGEASTGKPVSVPKTQPYGCGIKYAN